MAVSSIEENVEDIAKEWLKNSVLSITQKPKVLILK